MEASGGDGTPTANGDIVGILSTINVNVENILNILSQINTNSISAAELASRNDHSLDDNERWSVLPMKKSLICPPDLDKKLGIISVLI